jgi:hypothetical protein
MTEAEALVLVRRDGSALVYVPAAMRTAAVCAAAVKQHGHALRFVPAALRDEVQRRLAAA